MGGGWTRTESNFAASNDCKWTSWTEKAPPPCIHPLCPSLPFLPSSSFAKDALSQSEPCVLQCPHCTLGILRPAAQIKGVGAKKRLVTSSARASGERSRGRKGQNNPGPASCHTAVWARAWDIHLAFFLTPSPQHPHPPTSLLLNTASWWRPQRNINKDRNRQMRTSHGGWKRLHKKSLWNLKRSSVQKAGMLCSRLVLFEGNELMYENVLIPAWREKDSGRVLITTWERKMERRRIKNEERERAMEGGFLPNRWGCWPVCRY